MIAPYDTNSAQPYYGPVYADTEAAQQFRRRGQESGNTTRRFMREHGRYLSGLGAIGTPSGPGNDPDFADTDINRMESSDDTWGSGIFDQPGRQPTANENLGVFASSYSLPGFIAREIPFTVSRDVVDITNDAEMVFIPGGGLQYVEAGGRLRAPQVVGPTERFGGRRAPDAGTSREDTYVSLQSPNPRPTLNAGAPVREPASYQPARNNWAWVTPVPESWSRPVPDSTGRRVGTTSIVSPRGGPSVAVAPMRQPTLQGFGRMPQRLYAHSFGADTSSGPGVGTYALAGVIVGGAIGAALTMLKKKGR